MRKRVPSWQRKWASDNNANVARADCGTAGSGTAGVSPALGRRAGETPAVRLEPSHQVVSRSGKNERLARLVANTSDHGFESVRSLRGEVLAQSKAVEQCQRVDIENLARPLS